MISIWIKPSGIAKKKLIWNHHHKYRTYSSSLTSGGFIFILEKLCQLRLFCALLVPVINVVGTDMYRNPSKLYSYPLYIWFPLFCYSYISFVLHLNTIRQQLTCDAHCEYFGIHSMEKNTTKNCIRSFGLLFRSSQLLVVLGQK